MHVHVHVHVPSRICVTTIYLQDASHINIIMLVLNLLFLIFETS